jgi:hypothetical protein
MHDHDVRRPGLRTHRLLGVLASSRGLGAMAVTAAVLAITGCLSAPVQRTGDHAREARWAADFEPQLVVGDAVRLAQANGHRFVALWASGPVPSSAVILVHGPGVHPDHGLTHRLRADLFDAGWATLAIQAPVLDAAVTDGSAYASVMDDAAERLDVALAYVRARGAAKVFVVGHTMGSWMVNHWLARRPDQGLAGWASLGHTGNFEPFGANRMPTLDLYPDGGSHWARTGAPQRARVAHAANELSRQQRIEGTDLSFAKAEGRVREAIVAFFRGL